MKKFFVTEYGPTDCEPNEPKHWLAIEDEFGEEYCVIIVREPYKINESTYIRAHRIANALSDFAQKESSIVIQYLQKEK